jgi:hypothetical protein
VISKTVDPSKVITCVNEFWRSKKDERLEKEMIWKECWLAYNAKFGKSWSNVKRYRSRRYIPMSTGAVDAVSASRIQSLMPHDQWFNVDGRTPDDTDKAKVMASLMKWQHFKAKWRTQIARGIKQASIFGNLFWGVLWNTETSWVPDVEAYAGQLGEYALNGSNDPNHPRPDMPYKVRRNYDGPGFYSWNLFDAVTDRHPDDADTGMMVLQGYKTLAYIKKMAEPDPVTGYVLYENLDTLTEGSTQTEVSDSIRQEVDADLGFYNMPKNGVKLRTAWGDFYIEGEIYHNHVAVVANENTLIRFEPNPYWHGKRPWNLYVQNPDPLEIYGKGDLEVNLGMQDWVNARMNQIIEANALIVNPMLEVVNDGVVDVDKFPVYPGAIHLVSNPNSIRPINIPDTTEPGMREVGFAMAQFNESTGAMKSFSTENYQKSATEISATAGMNNSKAAEVVRHMESTLILPALEMQIQLNQQMMDEPTWIRVTQVDPQSGMENSFATGSQLMKVSPEDVQGEFDIFPVGASWLARNQQQQSQLLQYTQMIAQSPANPVIKWNQWAKWLMESAGVPEAYRFVKTDQELQYEQQQQMAMQAQQQMGGQPGPQGPPGTQGQPSGGGPQSLPGSSGPPPGGGAGTGPVTPTNGGPQRAG